jgi:hypothetical protein
MAFAAAAGTMAATRKDAMALAAGVGTLALLRLL